MYQTEAALLDDFASRLSGVDNPWGPVRVAREFFYRRGCTDLIAVTDGGHVLAFEGKLSRWRDALHQAYKNTCFADRSYVLLPKEVALLAQRYMTEFYRRGIGLCYIADGDIVVLEEARESKPLQPWLAEDAIKHASVDGNGPQ